MTWLFKFDESVEILQNLGMQDEVESIKFIEMQAEGNYTHVLENSEMYAKSGQIVNFINGLEIKLKEDQNRGVFANRDIKKGELIIVEKAIASVETTGTSHSIG